MIFCYTHRFVSYPVIFRDNSSCSRLDGIMKPTARHYMNKGLNQEVSIRSLPSERMKELDGMKDIRTRSNDSTKQGSYGLTETEVASRGSVWAYCTSFPEHVLQLLAWCFVGLLRVGVGVSFTHLFALGVFPFCWIAFFSLNVMAFALFSWPIFYFVLFSLIVSQRPVLF